MDWDWCGWVRVRLMIGCVDRVIVEWSEVCVYSANLNEAKAAN